MSQHIYFEQVLRVGWNVSAVKCVLTGFGIARKLEFTLNLTEIDKNFVTAPQIRPYNCMMSQKKIKE